MAVAPKRRRSFPLFRFGCSSGLALVLAALVAGIPLLVETPPAQATFPGKSGRIAFVREGDERGIYTVRQFGAGLTRLTHGQDYSPTWSPKGSRIAFQRFHGRAHSDIHVMDADGTHLLRLTRRGGSQPAWSPDGTKIVFVSDRDGDYELFVMNADGTDETKVTRQQTAETQPAWSPDGSTIAFVSRRRRNTDIYLMNPDGSNQRPLTLEPSIDQGPDWKPDGDRLVFESNEGHDDSNLFTIRPDGTEVRRLTHNDAIDWAPVWSPSGDSIAFTRARYGRGISDLVVMPTGAGDQYRIAISSATELEPDWQPV